ncbi:MAG TPA: V-type ATPase subunit [Candidatus Brocadiia bacterium]|nr:V-type ATPase subunit [Candidatus Brocadiia bacterium]
MQLTDWSFVSGRAAVMEGDLLKGDFFQGLLGHERMEDVFLQIGETRYKEIFTRIALLENAEELLQNYWGQSLDDFEDACPSPCVVALFRLATDFSNCKAFLKTDLFGLEQKYLTGGKYSREQFAEIRQGNAGKEDDYLAVPTRLLLEEVAAGRAIASTVDWIMDSAYLERLLECSEHTGSKTIRGVIEATMRLRAVGVIHRAVTLGEKADDVDRLFLKGSLDLDTLHSMLRSRPEDWGEALGHELGPEAAAEVVRGIQSGDRNAMARSLASSLALSVDHCRNVTYGPERPYGYLYGLEIELRNLKVVLAGLSNGISADQIGKRLLPSFV